MWHFNYEADLIWWQEMLILSPKYEPTVHNQGQARPKIVFKLNRWLVFTAQVDYLGESMVVSVTTAEVCIRDDQQEALYSTNVNSSNYVNTRLAN